MPSEARERFKESWNLESDDELDEALGMFGIVTLSVGDLATTVREAKYPLLVARSIAAAVDQLEAELRQVVPVLRQRGCTWTQIGVAIGTTKQSAWERFSGED
jgi:hypothetical protein